MHEVLFPIVCNTSSSNDSAGDRVHEKNLWKELKSEVIAMKVFLKHGTD